MNLVNGAVKKHVGQHKGKYFGGGSLGTLGIIVWAFFQLNLSIPALQKVPETQETVIRLEERIASQKETQIRLTEEVKTLTKAIDGAEKQISAVVAKLEIMIGLQKETRNDVKRILENE